MPALFTPLTVKDVTFRNRVGVAPMCQYSSTDGIATDWHMVHLGSKAVGGAGLIIAEATGVAPEGRITPSCAGIWNDQQVEALIPINRFIHEHGSVAGIQIAHSGRKGSSATPWNGGAHLNDSEGGWPVKGPANIPFDPDGKRLWKTPTAMTIEDIKTVQGQFVEATKRAIAAGYKLLEIHGAHGYLLHSFFTPLDNNRDDEYGGSLRNRARMMLEIVEAVSKIWPENLPLAVRLSAHDWIEGGLTAEDNAQMAIWLKDRGVDFVDCSGGGATPAARSSVGTRTADQVDVAAHIRKAAGIKTMAVGCITEAEQANTIIETGMADIVLLAREMLRNPFWTMHAAQKLGVDHKAFMPTAIGTFV